MHDFNGYPFGAPQSEFSTNPRTDRFSFSSHASASLLYYGGTPATADIYSLQANSNSQPFRYLVVIDFEANCEKDKQIRPCQEIIEFPAILYDLYEKKPITEFRQFVKPLVVKELTPFCTELTGITQEDVDSAPTFQEVLGQFHQWLVDNKLISFNDTVNTHSPWAIATIGDWDIKTLKKQATYYNNIRLESYFSSWINLKLIYRDCLKFYPFSLTTMMSDLEIQPMGRLHCGIDDVRNTCQVVTKLLGKPEGWDTAVFQLTSTLNGRYPGYVPGTVLEVQDKTGRRTQAPTLPIRKTTALLKRNRYSAPELSPQFIPYESSQFYSYLLNFAGSA